MNVPLMSRLTLSYVAVAVLTSLIVVLLVLFIPVDRIELDLPGGAALPFALGFAGLAALLSLPAALLVVLLTGRPLARRIARIAEASQRFAQGDLDARLDDAGRDEVGALAQQFNSMADALAQQVALLRALAEQNARLAWEAEEAGVAAERARMARHLHDAVAQGVFSFAYGASALPGLIVKDPQVGAGQAARLAAMAESVLLDLRAMLLHLRPLAVEAGGLPGALGQLAERWAALHGIQAVIDITPLTGLPAAVEDHLYPIAQEALHNIARHARAGQVWVTLSADDGAALLTIRDDGAGLDAGATPGWGIAHMRERAEALGGAFSIARAPAGGTIVRVRVPLRDAEEP